METSRLDPKQGIAFAFAGLLLVAYPLAAAAAFEWWSPRAIAGVWIVLALAGIGLRRRIEGRPWSELALIATPGLSLLFWAAVSNAEFPLRLLPALVNATLAVVFIRTLSGEQSIIEMGARMIQPRLPDFTRSYCRLSTGVWAAFFIASALVIGRLAWLGPESAWVAFTTQGYFIAMSVLGAAEFLVRKIHFRHYEGGLVDGIFGALFPAQNTAAGRRSAAFIAAQRAADLNRE